MFKITPIEDKFKQNEICDLCGAKLRPEAFAYQMFDMDTGKIMGMSQFEIGSSGYIYDIKEAPGCDDFEAMFILARQTMNFIDLCGNHICYAAKDAGNERLLRAVGFKDQADEFFCDMTGMFDGHCDGKKIEI
jgi:hypothetical protein